MQEWQYRGKSYEELLKEPRWISKRNAILKRDNFTCTVCGSKEHLQVHHTYYYNQPTPPWRYPEESLLTLCDNCHYGWHTQHENEYIDRPHREKKKRKLKPRRPRKRHLSKRALRKKNRTNNRLLEQQRRKERENKNKGVTRYRRLVGDKWVYTEISNSS